MRQLAIWLQRIMRHVSRWLLSHPSQAITALIVMAVHVSAIVICLRSQPRMTVLRPRNHVAVQTIQLREPKPKPKPEAKARARAEPKPKRQLKPKPQRAKTKPQQKKRVAKKPKPKPKPADVPHVDKKAQALIDNALASLDRIETVTPITSQKKSAQPADDVNPRDIGYCEELVRRLQLLLCLPEYGEVRIQLTLDREGRITKLKVVGADSEINRQYIERTLPSTKFPPFGTTFLGDQQHCFSLALTN